MRKFILLICAITAFTGAFAQSPPESPTGLKAVIDDWHGVKSIQLSWRSVMGKDIYFNVYRKVNNEPNFDKFPVRMHGTMFKDRFVIPNNTYYYFVTAENRYGESIPSDTISIEIYDNAPKAYLYGKVTDDESGDPLPAMVNIVPILGWSYRHLRTDSAGEYGSYVNAGKYFVSFASRGYYHEFYNNAPSIFSAETITLNEGDSLNVSAGLRSFIKKERYVLSGRVRNISGEGLKARVQLIILNRGIFDHHFRSTTTDSLGYYSLHAVEGDSIALFAMPMNRDYLPEFYNDKKEFTEADKFLVTSDVNNIDFILDTRPVYNNSISGRVTDENGEGLTATISAFKLRENNSRRFNRTVVTDSLGNYKLENLVPGNYLLLAVPIGGYLPSFFQYDGTQTFRWREADSVVVSGNSQLLGFDFNLLPVPDSGFARITGTVKDPSGSAVNGTMIYLMNENSIVSGYSISDENGKFTVDNLSPGKYTVMTSKFNYESSKEISIDINYSDNQQQSLQMTVTPLTVTSTKPVENVIRDYNLSQNYPNPFNPVTTIKYQIPEAGMVSLKVYNLIGQEIATLVNGQKTAGEYTVQFDARDLNSGIYFYKLTAGNKVYTRKMIVLK